MGKKDVVLQTYGFNLVSKHFLMKIFCWGC